MNDYLKKFKLGKWCDEINVEDFILCNYKEHRTYPDFLCGPTKRTSELMEKLNALIQKETLHGGVLDIDTTRVSSPLNFEAGYLDKEKELIVGLQTDEPLKRAVNPFGGFRLAKKACEAYGYKISDEITNAFGYKTTHNDGVFRVYTDEMRAARHTGIITGLPDAYGRGRIIGDYRRVALYGVDRLIEEKMKDKKALGEGVFDADSIKLSEELYQQINFLGKLKEMAEIYGYDISEPAKNAKEAVQWVYFAYLAVIKEQNGAATSLGRVSTFLDIFIEKDIELGVLSETEAQELIDDFVMKLRMARHLRTPEYNELFGGDPMWITESIGGIIDENRSLVTKTSYRFLQTLYNLGPAPEPNITVLWSEHLPEEFKKFCAKVSIDTDSIQYENDDIMRPDYGSDYAIACCVSAMKVGKQMQFFGARCNLPKLLLLALNGGKDENYSMQVGPERDVYPDEILDYNKVCERLNFYREWLCRLYINTLNVIHYMHDKYHYEKTQMALHDTEVTRFMACGIAGLSVMADSLSAIKYATVKVKKNEDGLIYDFETIGDFPKYGNDDDRVDQIAVEQVKLFYNEICKNKTYRNSIPTLSILTITSNVVYGKKTGNTPDGRKKGEPFAPGANPMHNRDTSGALCSLNSVAKIPYSCCRDGVSNTFSIVPDALGENPIQTLVEIIDGYFCQSAHHLNVNVLNKEMLIDAVDHPEKYPGLTIRVSGYAVNFHRLSKEQKLEVIKRTFHESM